MNPGMQAQKKSYLYAIATVLLWSTVATAFKLSLRYLGVLPLLLISSVVSLIVFALLITFQGKWPLVFGGTKADYLRSAWLGFLNPFLYYVILLRAYDLLPAQAAQPLNYTWAVTLALLSILLLGQKIRAVDFIAALICYTGVLVIATKGAPWTLHFSSPLGVILALGSTLIWALFWIYNTKDPRDPVVGMFLNFFFALPWILGATLLFSSLKRWPLYGWIGAIYVGLFEMGITFVLWLSALKLSTNHSRIGNLIFLSPFLSLLFIYFLLGENIHWSTPPGLALIITGLMIQQIKQKPGSP